MMTVIVSAVLLAMVALLIRSMWKDHKAGGGCGGCNGCSGCSGGTGCCESQEKH